MQLMEVLLGLAAVNASEVFIATICLFSFFLIILHIYLLTLRLPHCGSELDVNGRRRQRWP